MPAPITETIYVAPHYPMYRVWKVIGGYKVVYIQDSHNYREIDGGKVHKNRQNAYKKADRLNHPLKYIFKHHEMAECYFDGDTVYVRDEEDGEYSLSACYAAMPPYFQMTGTLAELEDWLQNSKFRGETWKAIKPEEI